VCIQEYDYRDTRILLRVGFCHFSLDQRVVFRCASKAHNMRNPTSDRRHGQYLYYTILGRLCSYFTANATETQQNIFFVEELCDIGRYQPIGDVLQVYTISIIIYYIAVANLFSLYHTSHQSRPRLGHELAGTVLILCGRHSLIILITSSLCWVVQ